jgi:putative transposase
MLAKDRAKILFAAGRWWVALNAEAADLHPARCHPVRDNADHGGWVGVDRGLTAFVVAATADGHEVARITDAPKALAGGMRRQQHLAKQLSRKKEGSHHRRDVAAQLGRHHRGIRNIRTHFLHQVSNRLVKTHDRLVLEDLNVSGMLATTASPKRSATPAGPSSLAGCATRPTGETARSWSLTAGIPQARSAGNAVPATPT